MASFYGRKSTQVTSYFVNSVNTTGGTIISQGDDANGDFYVRFQHNNSGCGGADSGIFVELKDIFAWTGISCRFRVLGSASCWSFSNSSAYGAAVGASGTANLQNYSYAAGDRLSQGYLSYEQAAYSSHDPIFACDNNSNNFMIYNTGVYRGFNMTRRRNVNGSLAGIHHGRSCNTTGSGSITIIKNIMVW